MNKVEIIKIMKDYNFDINEYAIISSAAMVLHGIKKSTKDIDIYVSPNYYEYLLKKYNCKYERINKGTKIYYIDDVINFGINYKPNKIELINGLAISSIEDIVLLKESLKREKDIKDIKLIKEFKRLK